MNNQINKIIPVILVLLITLSLSAESKKKGFFSRLFGRETKTEKIETPQAEVEQEVIEQEAIEQEEVESEEASNDKETNTDIISESTEEKSPKKEQGLHQAHSSIEKNLEKNSDNQGLMNAKAQIEKNMEKKDLEVPATDQDESIEDTGASAETVEEVASAETQSLVEEIDSDEAVLGAKEMKTESKEIRTQAKLEAQEMRDEAKLESKEIRTEAKEQVRELRDEAKLEAKEIRNQAKEEAKEKRNEAKQEAKDK